MSQKRVRHILGLSGGKDSTALAVLLHKVVPNLESFFCDTGKELPETYAYLEKIEAKLRIKIKRLSAERDFDFWLALHDGYLPSPKRRWCTEQMKIKPLEKEFGGNDKVYSYIGIRADEIRDGYLTTTGSNIIPVYPFRKRQDNKPSTVQALEELGIYLPFEPQGYNKAAIHRLLEDFNIGLPDYYRWRSRSGCFFCFYQRKYEWVKLAEEHPDKFAEAVQYEKSHKDGRTYTWSQGETLEELLARKDEIIAEHGKALVRHQAAAEKKKANAPDQSLIQALEEVLDEEDDSLPCLMCHL